MPIIVFDQYIHHFESLFVKDTSYSTLICVGYQRNHIWYIRLTFYKQIFNSLDTQLFILIPQKSIDFLFHVFHYYICRNKNFASDNCNHQRNFYKEFIDNNKNLLTPVSNLHRSQHKQVYVPNLHPKDRQVHQLSSHYLQDYPEDPSYKYHTAG